LTASESTGFLKGSTVYAGIVNGFNRAAQPAAGVGSVQTSYYVGATVATPVTALKVGASYDHARQSSVPGSDSTHQDAVAGYASVQATEKLSLHARGEYFWQNQSLATDQINAIPLSASPPFGVLPSKVVALTGTLQYDLWKNVLSRLEIRWDHAANGRGAYGGDISNPPIPGPGDKKNSVLVAANVIYKF
jgi:hypothetical protein